MTKKYFRNILFLYILLFLGISSACAQKDSSFYSQAFETERWYRIYLPSTYYSNPDKEYPVVYYFRGYGGRYKWDEYDLDYDPEYPGNGRVHPLFVKEWREYAETHEVIIVTWDGYEPNLHPGQKFREGIPYGWCPPYDYPRAHDKNIVQWGWDYREYFRDLVAHIDSNYRSIANRDHRAITGLSMGGLTSLYVSGQNKDLISSVSAFCPADNIPMYGPKGYLSVFPVLEMYRSLSGLSVRLTANDGDWLFANDKQMRRIISGSGQLPFEYHLADFPDHGVADADLQLDFHMNEFNKPHPLPDNWDHICPSFTTFSQWNWNFTIDRPQPALTVLNNMSKSHVKIFGRKFIPDGPIVADETVNVQTDSLYKPSDNYNLIVYNLTSHDFSTQQIQASAQGQLQFTLAGGGNIVGINGNDTDKNKNLRVVFQNNSDYLYFEEAKIYHLNFDLVNVSDSDITNISIKAYSNHASMNFAVSEISGLSVPTKEALNLENQFTFALSKFNLENLTGNISLEISINGVIADTQQVVFFTTPESPYISPDDIIILDGRSQYGVPVFNQGYNSVRSGNLYGGNGNGNGIAEKGEEIVVYIRIPQGLAPNDKNSFHKTYLIGEYEAVFASTKKLKYDEKMDQAGSTSISSIVSISDKVPETDSLDLWFRLESLYNDNNVPAARRVTYEYGYDYRRIRIPVADTNSSGTNNNLQKNKNFKLGQNYPNPMRNQTLIEYYVGETATIKLKILDIKGQEIKELVSEVKAPGDYSAIWDGTNSYSKLCTTGVYIYQMQTPLGTIEKKMTLIR